MAGQRFEIYFVLQPPTENDRKWLTTITTKELQMSLRVRVCAAPEKDKDKKKPDELTPVLDRLPITNLTADNIDPSAAGTHDPGQRLVLYVTDNSSRPR